MKILVFNQSVFRADGVTRKRGKEKATPRVCLIGTRFTFSFESYPDYSEYTGGDPADGTLSCLAGHSKGQHHTVFEGDEIVITEDE